VRRFRGEGLAVLSGLLLTLCFPKFGHGLVAFVALVPLLVALAEASGLRALRLGFLTGFVAGVGLLYWTSLVVVQYGGLTLPVGIVAMLLLAAAVALFPTLFAGAVALWRSAFGTAALLAAPVAWVATEVLRAYTFFRFPWCLLGYSQADNLPLVQIAAATGVYGVSLVVAAVSAALAFAVVTGDPLARRRALLGTALGLVAVTAVGAWQLQRPFAVTGQLAVGLVQADIRQDDKWAPGKALDNVRRHLELTRRAAAQGARLVVWPESSVPFLWDREPGLRATLSALVARDHLYLLFGNDDREATADARDRIFVGAKLLAPDGHIGLRYHKMRLVPFGEYTPLEPLVTLGGRYSARLVQEVGRFTPGQEAAVGEVDGHLIGGFICYEAIFPDLVRRFTAKGAGLLANMTNDAWYGTTSAPYQHFQMARLRAVENGRYLVRAANTGISGVVDLRGRIVAATGLFEPAALVVDVPIAAGTTFYVRYGDVFAGACLLAAAALSLAALPRARRA